MMLSFETLEALTIQEVPADFFKQLAVRQPAVYAEANDMALNSPSWRAPEGEMVEPYIRRALFEHEFRLAAKNAKLHHDDMRHAGDNCGYGMVRAGKLAISTHHIGGPKHFVRACKSRKQNAAVNKFLDQLVLDEILIEPIPKLDEAGIVYAHLLHGRIIERRGDKEFSQDFLRFAFPDADLKRYTKNYSVLEILQKYAALEGAGVTPSQGTEDKVVPILNPKKKTEVVND